MKKKAVILILLSLLLIRVDALFSQEINTKTYLTEDGLPSNLVYEVFQDSDRFIWFSTELGVSRFDGRNFKNHSFKNRLLDNVLFEVKEIDKNRKWFLSGNGDRHETGGF